MDAQTFFPITFSLFFRAPCPFNLTYLSFLHHLFLPAEIHNFPFDSSTADCGTKTRLFAKHTLTYTSLHVHLDVHRSCQIDHLSESFLSKGYMLWTLLNPCSSIFLCNLNDQTAQREDAYLMLWCRNQDRNKHVSSFIQAEVFSTKGFSPNQPRHCVNHFFFTLVQKYLLCSHKIIFERLSHSLDRQGCRWISMCQQGNQMLEFYAWIFMTTYSTVWNMHLPYVWILII